MFYLRQAANDAKREANDLNNAISNTGNAIFHIENAKKCLEISRDLDRMEPESGARAKQAMETAEFELYALKAVQKRQWDVVDMQRKVISRPLWAADKARYRAEVAQQNGQAQIKNGPDLIAVLDE